MPTFTVKTTIQSENRVTPVSSATPFQLLVVGAESYSSQDYINFVLSGLSYSTPISLVMTLDNFNPSIWAREWAVANGVPYVNMTNRIQSLGLNHFQSAIMVVDQVSHVVAFGTHAKTTAAANAGTLHGKKVLQM
jgi:hypothetical protein